MRAVLEKTSQLPPEHTKGQDCQDEGAQRYESEWKQHTLKQRKVLPVQQSRIHPSCIGTNRLIGKASEASTK